MLPVSFLMCLQPTEDSAKGNRFVSHEDVSVMAVQWFHLLARTFLAGRIYQLVSGMPTSTSMGLFLMGSASFPD